MDGLLRFGLVSLPWFTKFLARIKAILKTLREHSQDIVDYLVVVGLGGAAAVIDNMSAPYFAAWRWRTLHKACAALRQGLDTFFANFGTVKEGLSRRKRDKTVMRQVASAHSSIDFKWQFEFVDWFTTEMNILEQFASACPCHLTEWENGQHVDCDMSGRVLPLLYDFAEEKFARLLRVGNELEAALRSTCKFQQLAHLQGCLRAVVQRGRKKIENLDRVPVLLCRLGHPGVRERCVEQWASAPAHKHDPITREFLCPSGYLRGLVDDMDGEDMAQPLRLAIKSLACCPVDDSIAESPHACARRVGLSTRAQRFPWCASTMRLPQNLRDYRSFVAGAGISAAQALWDSPSAIVQHRKKCRYMGHSYQKKGLVRSCVLHACDSDCGRCASTCLVLSEYLPSLFQHGIELRFHVCSALNFVFGSS